MEFELHPHFINKDFIINLSLCCVLLEDDFYYPWILLIPRRPQVGKIMDLNSNDQLQLLKELDLAQQIIWNCFTLNQLNVAALGNKTPQLHVHIVGRKREDPAWPHTVWDHPTRRLLPLEQKKERIALLRSYFLKQSEL